MKAWMVYYWPRYIRPRQRRTINKLGSEPFYQEGNAIVFAHTVNDLGGHAEEPEPFELSRRFALWLHMMRHTDWDEYEPPSMDDPDATLLTGPPPPRDSHNVAPSGGLK